MRHVLVAGSSGVDIKGAPFAELVWETSNLGRVRNSVGGVARNIAENLARLEVPVTLLTAVGRDTGGRRVISACEEAGVDCSYVCHIPGGRTGTYLALLHPNGQLNVAVSDFEIMSQVTAEYIREHRYLIAEAEMVVVDATLSESALATVIALADEYDVRVVADPTTPTLAANICPYLSQLYMIVPNAAEVPKLCGVQGSGERDQAVVAARELVTRGVKLAVVTLGAEGLVYADGGGGGYIKAINTHVVDSTGAGDAFTGAVIFGLLNGVPVDEAMRLGATAASLTLESSHTVLPEISQELLYEKLTF